MLSSPAMNLRIGRGLYGILDISAAAPLPGRTARQIYASLFAARAPVVQLRMKNASAAAMLALMTELRTHRPPETLLIVNDRLDVALATEADGVHLGQDDLPLLEAQRIVKNCGRKNFLLGISTHNAEQAAAALRGGADYIALGPIYATTSKANPDPVVGLEELAALCQIATCPVVAIGGITVERAAAVAAAGAQMAAIISAVNYAPDALAAATAVQACFCASRN